MHTYLFVWNPKRWTWVTLENDIERVRQASNFQIRWSCGKTKSIKLGDRAFLIKVGTEPKGIIAAGYVTTTPTLDKHWGDESTNSLYVQIQFEALLNPNKNILPLEVLKTGNLAAQNWTPQSSGISIRPELVDELEVLWSDLLSNQYDEQSHFISIDKAEGIFKEGTPKQSLTTSYERNPFARKKCLEHYGYSCSICNFNFEDTYGEIGRNFIHVHHLNQISTFGKEYHVNPIKDLRPVCPNCHYMIHKRNPPFTIEEIKSVYNKP